MSRTTCTTRVRFFNARTNQMSRAYVVGYLMGMAVLSYSPHVERPFTFTVPVSKVMYV